MVILCIISLIFIFFINTDVLVILVHADGFVTVSRCALLTAQMLLQHDAGRQLFLRRVLVSARNITEYVALE